MIGLFRCVVNGPSTVLDQDQIKEGVCWLLRPVVVVSASSKKVPCMAPGQNGADIMKITYTRIRFPYAIVPYAFKKRNCEACKKWPACGKPCENNSRLAYTFVRTLMHPKRQRGTLMP
jgi:hypothetical protein